MLITNCNKTYIHYGSNEFIKDLVYLRKSHSLDQKPDRGLWACPIDAHCNWKDWCENEDFCTDRLSKSFKFKLKSEAKIFYVEKETEGFGKYIISSPFYFPKLNRDALYQDFDAMEICHDYDGVNMHYGFYNTWDVDSICVWNGDMILPIKK